MSAKHREKPSIVGLVFESNDVVIYFFISCFVAPTDNIFAVKSWCKKKFYMEDSEINKNLGIPSNFDYYEEN